MALTLDLTPEQEHRLQVEAARSGLPLTEYALRRLLGDLPEKELPAPDAENQALMELLRRWREEDDAMTPEEAETAEMEWEELKANLNANRAATGEEPLF
jgi:hypothetical protein